MTLSRRLRAAVFTAAVCGGTAAAQAPVVPAGGAPQVPYPIQGQPCPCPPGPFMPGQVIPYMPGGAPVVPAQPGQTTPGGQKPAPKDDTKPTPQTNPSQTPQPNQNPSPQTNPSQTPQNTAPPAANDSLASATAPQGGGGTGGTNLPGIFGDLFGGAAVPIAIGRFDARGNAIGTVFNTRVPGTNTFRPVTGINPATNELLTGQYTTVQPATTPVSFTRVLTDVDPNQVIAATRVPTFNRGQFKITENETPRPTTRAYFTYNFYDNLFKSVGSNTPRVSLHQENFGYEQAFGDQQYSIGLRLPYNQVVSPGFYNQTSIGDLTIVTKAVLAENRATGDLLSYGLTVTTPTGSIPNSSFASTSSRGVLLQPYLGYILTSGDLFLQGFSSIIVPTDSADTTIYSQSLALGYTLFKRPGDGLITGIYPVFEAHLNTPLNHRSDQRTSTTVLFPDNLTLLGGTFFELYGRSNLGFAAGAPVTGPRPFSLQATALLSVRF